MRVLLDSCAFLWIIGGSTKLSPEATAIFQDPNNEVYLSAVSTWEICVKAGLGKLPLPEDPSRLIPKHRESHGIRPLPLGEAATLYAHKLPDHHRDPFDRMLVCQALAENMTILTPDKDIAAYPVRTAW